MNKQILAIIICGLIFKLVIAAITFHPDVKIINYTSAVFLKEGNFNPYSYTGDLKGSEVPDDLPLQYFIKLPFEVLVRPLISPNVELQFLSDTKQLFGSIELLKHLLLIKLPVLIFDLLLGLILIQLIPKSIRLLALSIWIFNPVNLWATAAIGQVDIIPTTFLVLVYYFVYKKQNLYASFALGIGGAIKSFPFLLLPFLIMTGKNLKERVLLGLVAVVPLLISVTPYLTSEAFRRSALFASQLDKIFFSRITLSGGEAIFVNVLVLTVSYLLYLKAEKSFLNFVAFSTLALLNILSFTHFHPQWYLWVLPGLLILSSYGLIKNKLPLAILMFSWLGMVALFEASLQVGLLAPIFPNLQQAPGLAELLSEAQLTFGKSIMASAFAGASLYLSFRLIFQSRDVK